MKAIKFIVTLITISIFFGCQDLVEPELSSENSLTSISCVVVLTAKMTDIGSKPEDEKKEFAGNIADNGIVSFPEINTLTDQQKQQARFVATVPLTCKIVEKDGTGKIIGEGIGGLRSISKKTYYFYVVAANANERKYVLTFN